MWLFICSLYDVSANKEEIYFCRRKLLLSIFKAWWFIFFVRRFQETFLYNNNNWPLSDNEYLTYMYPTLHLRIPNVLMDWKSMVVTRELIKTLVRILACHYRQKLLWSKAWMHVWHMNMNHHILWIGITYFKWVFSTLLADDVISWVVGYITIARKL
jgi:hypothetical protein